MYPSVLPDLSGLSWIADDLFVGVHDAKNNDEKKNWPRVSLIQLPLSEAEGAIWRPSYPDFPGPGGVSSDLESSCSIPGTKDFLFVESGQEGANFSRIFHARYLNSEIEIIDYTNWPVGITNVEATEVFRVGEQLVFLYAERAEGEPSTNIRWANLSLNPLDFGDFQEVTFEGIDPVGPGARPVVAMEIDSEGFIYIVSAYDSGSDDGPYRSVVWLIGQVLANNEGHAMVELGNYQRLGTLDGLKVESIAVRELSGEAKQVFIGTDDEHYGGIIRLLP
ncbi:MAG: hypothetical protein R6W71_10125 [Bacteroidales bacterium]